MIAPASLFGFPLPSSDPKFLVLVSVHVALGPPAVIAGALAMLSTKGRGRHSKAGTVYFWSLAGLFVTMSMLAFLRWSQDYHLFLLGALSFGAAMLGRYAIHQSWVRMHLACMATSYIVMLIAFYVDNGKNLPIWKDLPAWTYWFLPLAVGVPLTVRYLVQLPYFSLPSRSGPA
jgi:uncharacterized membrane protein